MGGEFEKQTEEKTPNKNTRNLNSKKLKAVSKGGTVADENKPINEAKTDKKSNSKTAGNRSVSKHKKEKISIVAKEKENEEKKVLEVISNNNKEKKDYELINGIIEKHFFLHTLNEQARNEIIVNMSLCKLQSGKTLTTQGSIGNFWYIVHSGILERFVDGKLSMTIKAGESFGERALMHDCPRSGTIIAKEECQLWVLRRQEFRKILNYIFTVNYNENMKFLETVNIPLDSTIKSIMASNLIQELFFAGQYIFREGEIGSCMYIVKEGEVECMKGEKVIRVLKKGDNFGQRALMQGEKRSLDIRARTDCKLYSISSEFFKNQFGENYRDQLYFSFLNLAFVNSKVFNKINSKIIFKTFRLFEFKSFKHNEVIYKSGDNIMDKLCVVLEGNIVDKKINKIEAKRYEILFESELAEGNNRKIKNDLLAEPDCIIAEADYEKVKNLFGGDIKAAQKKSTRINDFDNVALFKILSEEKAEFLQEHLNIEKFNNGKKIFSQGDIGNKLYIIKQGRVDFFINSKYMRSFGEGQDFGSRSLVIANSKRSTTAIANGSVVCYTLTSDVFKSILEYNLKEYFQQKIYLMDNTIELKDLESIKDLGSGSYGFVNLVRNKKNKQLYAIKALNVSQIKKEGLELSVELEKNVLLKTDHPFIMKMVKYLKNDNYIFFLMEYIQGKELWEVMRDIGLLNTEQTQFYGASMLLAINYLHNHKIIYRDIKPENIMVTEKGYIKIIDFGTVKEIEDRTSTVIGTSHYMAPEVVKGEGYSFQVDVWSIAICMYEFFCGKVPFGEEYEDPMDIYRSVSQEELSFPKFVHDDKFMALLNKMLKKSPTNRLWKFEQIKEEPYFRGFDWNKLISLSFDVPYKLEPKDEIENNKSIPYLSFLQSKQEKKPQIKKRTNSQVKFDKWLKNF